MPSETIAVFGASGRTGEYFVLAALEQGYKIRALCRTPSKLGDQLLRKQNVTIFQGDLTNKAALQETVKGATYVVSMAGGPDNNRTYPDLMMTNFVRMLWPILEAEPSVKTFLYQSSCLTNRPDGTVNPLALRVARPIEGVLLGIRKGVYDNECAAKFMADAVAESTLESFKVIVIRPGKLNDTRTAASRPPRKLVASQQPQIRALEYRDLAAFNLQAMKDESLEGQYPFVVFAE